MKDVLFVKNKFKKSVNVVIKSEQMDASHCHEIENNPATNIM